MSDYSDFLKDKAFWKELDAWFKDLQNNRGNRAKLRRAKTPFDVYISTPFQRDLLPRLSKIGINPKPWEQERLALGIGVLANAKSVTENTHFARQLAKAEKGSQEVRDIRFRKLLAIENRDELYTMLIRLTRYLDGVVELKGLVKGAFWWNDNSRRKWAEKYYTAT